MAGSSPYLVRMTDSNPSNGPYKLIETPYHKYGKVPNAFQLNSPHLRPMLTTTQLPKYRIATEMALAHNAYIRSLNAIYLQSTSIPTRDVPDFLTYCQSWYEAVQHHHDSEENMFFPRLEEVTSKESLMDVNVDQHKAFHDKLETWGKKCYDTAP